MHKVLNMQSFSEQDEISNLPNESSCGANTIVNTGPLQLDIVEVKHTPGINICKQPATVQPRSEGDRRVVQFI
jgi:hypothetical protein